MTELTRNLKRYMAGEDVARVKARLVELGYLHKATHNRFGNDTYRAVRAFQQDRDLTVDGIVGPITYQALFGEEGTDLASTVCEAEGEQATTAGQGTDGGKEPIATDSTGGEGTAAEGEVSLPAHIGNTAATAIKTDLERVDSARRQLCLTALEYATDPENPDYPRGFYIRGANLFDTDLTLHRMTEARLSRYFKREAYAPYYDGGRKEMMLRFAEAHGYGIPGADCSGFIVGLWRACGVVKANFDANADSLFGRYCVQTDAPSPGDLCHRSGHIGLYVGGGYAVEAAGGAYGVQVTRCAKRRVYSFVTGKYKTLSAWSGYGNPKGY